MLSFLKSAKKLEVVSYVEFLKMFHLNSPLFAPFDPASMPADSTDNPLALVKGIAMGITPELSEDLEDPKTEITQIYYLRNAQDDWIVHGEYTTPEETRLFMMMFGTNTVIEDGEPETYFLSYAIFDLLVANTEQECVLHPETIVTGIHTDQNEVLYHHHPFPREFGMALCLTDATFCQILANQSVDMKQNQRWVKEYPASQRAQKIASMRERNFDMLRSQITQQAAGQSPVAGLMPQPL